MPSLTSIAEQLLAQAKQIDSYLESKKLSSPSFDIDSLKDLPAELQDVRNSLASGSNDLRDLARGPVGSTMDIAFSWTTLLALRVIHHYKIAQAVPVDGSASYAEIASKSGLREDLVFRFLRVTMNIHVFDEDPATGRVRHTAASHELATNIGFADAVGLETEDLAPAGLRMIEAWGVWGQNAVEHDETAFALANEKISYFETLGKQPERGRRFDNVMRFFTTGETWDLKHLLHAFDWKALDRPGARVVDMGGGKGQVSQFLARHTDQVSFLVQDLAHVLPAAREELPADLKGRVEFAEHNILEPQKLDPAPDVFFMRWILHSWSDSYSVRILQGLIPAMRPGTRILIYEYLLEDAPVRTVRGRFGLQLDLMVLTVCNGRERRRVDFERVLAKSDKRFVLKAVHRPEGSTMSLVEIVWTPWTHLTHLEV